jgi:AraC family transcriptional regulator, chitin signaling transcriptional activator
MGFLLMGLFISLFLAGFISQGIAQNHYTVFHYHPNDYQGDNQNWDICKDANGRVFIANNAGLLVYDGAQSRLFELPQKSILRSVNCIDNKVYTGSFEEFGYWEEKDNFAWQYHSLVSLVDPEIFQNDEFWKIVELNGMIYFQSFGNILMNDRNKVENLSTSGFKQCLVATTTKAISP